MRLDTDIKIGHLTLPSLSLLIWGKPHIQPTNIVASPPNQRLVPSEGNTHQQTSALGVNSNKWNTFHSQIDSLWLERACNNWKLRQSKNMLHAYAQILCTFVHISSRNKKNSLGSTSLENIVLFLCRALHYTTSCLVEYYYSNEESFLNVEMWKVRVVEQLSGVEQLLPYRVVSNPFSLIFGA